MKFDFCPIALHSFYGLKRQRDHIKYSPQFLVFLFLFFIYRNFISKKIYRNFNRKNSAQKFSHEKDQNIGKILAEFCSSHFFSISLGNRSQSAEKGNEVRVKSIKSVNRKCVETLEDQRRMDEKSRKKPIF